MTLELLDGSGHVLATGVTGPANVSLVIRNFVAPVPGTYYARVAGTGATDYSLMVTFNTEFDFEGNGTLAGAQDLRQHAVFGAIGNVCMTDSDFYAFGANAGDNVHLATATPAGGAGEFVNTFFPEILLYDQNGNLVAVAAGNASDGRNSVIDFTVPAGGVWRVQITASPNTPSPSTGEYVLTVNGNTGTPPPSSSPGTDGCGLLTAASPAHLWIGLKNGDDQGTQFDLKVELTKNGTVVASGLQRCITGVTRNASLAKEAVVAFDAFSSVPVATGDVLALNVSTRIGTNPDDTKCAGHNSATGLRLYYDSTNRPSRFDTTITPDPSEDDYCIPTAPSAAARRAPG